MAIRATQTYERYLMELLEFPNLKELREFLNAPEAPTGGMRPPNGHYEDIDQLMDMEELKYQHQR